jgi:hypothetical protein
MACSTAQSENVFDDSELAVFESLRAESRCARDLARKAMATLAARPGFEAQRREAQAWLDKRGQTIGM